MKHFKKLGSILLAAAMCLSLSVPAFAADIASDNTTGEVPVVVTTPEDGNLTFKVTLPAAFTVDVDANGTVTTATNLKLINGSAGSVDVTDVSMEAAGGWALADYDGNFGRYGVGQKVIGMEINGCKTSATGLAFDASKFVNDQGETYMWAAEGNGIIPEHHEMALSYGAKIPGQNSSQSDVTVANVVFTVAWHTTGTGAETPEPREPVCAVIYFDTNELVFQEGKTLEEGRSGWAYDQNIETTTSVPWEMDRNEITAVTFNCDVAPVSIAGWFSSMSALTTINNIENLDTSKLSSLAGFGCASLKTIYASGPFVIADTTDASHMFEGCTSLVGGNGTTYDSNHISGEYARIDAPGAPGYFTSKSTSSDDTATYVILYDDGELVFQQGSTPEDGRTVTATYDYKNVENGSDIKPWHANVDKITSVTFETDVAPVNTAYWFSGCSNLATVNGMEHLDTSNTTDMHNMFSSCDKLSSLDVSSWTPDMTYGDTCNMQAIFTGCNITLYVSASEADNWTSLAESGYLNEAAGSITVEVKTGA